MAIYEYNDGDHGGGFIGLRVAVKVGDIHIQRYYSFRRRASNKTGLLINRNYRKFVTTEEEKALRKAAKTYEAKLLMKQAKVTQKRKNQATPTSRSTTGTGVRGIILYQGYLQVQGSHNKKPFYRKFNIEPDIEKAWEDAVRFYAKSKKLTRWRHLIKRRESF